MIRPRKACVPDPSPSGETGNEVVMGAVGADEGGSRAGMVESSWRREVYVSWGSSGIELVVSPRGGREPRYWAATGRKMEAEKEFKTGIKGGWHV